MTLSEKLQIIKNSTDDIKSAIQEIGGIVYGDITTWADVIRSCKRKQINKLTVNGASIVATYPVKSKLTVSVYGRPSSASSSSMPTIFDTWIYKGETRSVSNARTIMYINSVNPKEDDDYIYI